MDPQAPAFPYVNALEQECLTDEQAQFFVDNGLIIIRNLLHGEELAELRQETLALVEMAEAGQDSSDYMYRNHEITGQRVPFRVEYVIDKTKACKRLLAHPFVLRTVEKLQGPNFIPTWDSMVFKREGAGVAVPWHRDGGVAGLEQALADRPIFNVDFYLDRSDLSNCLWGIPGSNRLTPEEAALRIAELTDDGFHTEGEGVVPILMNAGDVLLHNVLALHGSPPAQSHLRRVIYLEFRPADVEHAAGPHTSEYIPLKQLVLLDCLRHRAAAPFARGEEPFAYRPDQRFSPPSSSSGADLSTHRYPHELYWRGNN